MRISIFTSVHAGRRTVRSLFRIRAPAPSPDGSVGRDCPRPGRATLATVTARSSCAGDPAVRRWLEPAPPIAGSVVGPADGLLLRMAQGLCSCCIGSGVLRQGSLLQRQQAISVQDRGLVDIDSGLADATNEMTAVVLKGQIEIHHRLNDESRADRYWSTVHQARTQVACGCMLGQPCCTPRQRPKHLSATKARCRKSHSSHAGRRRVEIRWRSAPPTIV